MTISNSTTLMRISLSAATRTISVSRSWAAPSTTNHLSPSFLKSKNLSKANKGLQQSTWRDPRLLKICIFRTPWSTLLFTSIRLIRIWGLILDRWVSERIIVRARIAGKSSWGLQIIFCSRKFSSNSKIHMLKWSWVRLRQWSNSPWDLDPASIKYRIKMPGHPKHRIPGIWVTSRLRACRTRNHTRPYICRKSMPSIISRSQKSFSKQIHLANYVQSLKVNFKYLF